MRRSEWDLRSLIREMTYEEERAAVRSRPNYRGWKVPPAPEDAPLGQYAFAPERAAIWWDMPDEPNTPAEQKLYDDLYKHIDKNISITDDAIALIIDLIQSGLYPDVFKPAADVPLYRGVVLPRETVESWGIIPDNPAVRKSVDRQFTPFDVDMVINPRSHQRATSWTTREDLAKHFTRYRGGNYAEQAKVVMVASPADNPDKFFDLSGFYTINNSTAHYMSEKEFLGAGAIKINKLLISNMRNPHVDAFGNPLY